MRGNFSEFILCTRDEQGLYSRVAGTMTGCGLNILGSYVYTGRSGVALEVYRVSTPEGRPCGTRFRVAGVGESFE